MLLIFIFLYLLNFTFNLIPSVISLNTTTQIQQSIRNKIFQNYNKYVKPGDPVNDLVIVNMQLDLIAITNVNEVSQLISIHVYQSLSWVDERFKWDVNDGIHVSQISTYTSDVWLPDVVLYDDIRDETKDISGHILIITNDGMVHYDNSFQYIISCQLDMQHFPFDEQICAIWFGSWSNTADQLQIIPRNVSDVNDKFQSNNAFELIGFPFRGVMRPFSELNGDKNAYSEVQYVLIIRRRPLYYIVNLVLPCVALVIVTLFAFKLPADSGERMSLNVAILLSLTFFLQLVNSQTPTQSTSIPLLSIYFGATLIITALSTVASVLILMLHFEKDSHRPMPNVCRFLVLDLMARMVMLRYWTQTKEYGGKARPKLCKYLEQLFQRYWSKDKVTMTINTKHTGESNTEPTNNSEFSTQNTNEEVIMSDTTTTSNRENCSDVSKNELDKMTDLTISSNLSKKKKIEKKKHRKKLKPNTDTHDEPDDNQLEIHLCDPIVNILDKILFELSTLEINLQNKESLNRMGDEWEAAAVVLDRFFFAVFIIATVLLSVIVFVILPGQIPYYDGDKKKLWERFKL